MIIKGITDEDFVNYKKPSMLIAFPSCTFKCDKECGEQVCQNGALATAHTIDIACKDIVSRYMSNPITSSIVMQGLEPFDSQSELLQLIQEFRNVTSDDIVIYTGYNKVECPSLVDYLSAHYKNIVIKFGRYVPHDKPHYDEVLGVKLASDNQYAERIS